MEKSQAPANQLELIDEEFFAISASGARNFSIRRVRGVHFETRMTDRLAIEMVRALQSRIRRYSEFQTLGAAA